MPKKKPGMTPEEQSERFKKEVQRLVDAGRGDVPLIELRWRCANCGSRLTDFVCTGRSAIGVKPWRAGVVRDG